jgi:hypothetical protein
MSGDKRDEIFITKEELADGYKNLPKISLVTQKNLRSSGQLKYTTIGRIVHYTYAWVMEYIENNKKN